MGAAPRRRGRGLATTIVAIASFAALAPAAGAAAAQRGYIVQLKARPLASYTGGVRGIPATSPKATGRRLSTTSAASRSYRDVLGDRQRAALDRVSGAAPTVTYRYRTAFAGFAARMTAAQAAQLRRAPEVALVTRDRLAHPTATDPDATLGGHTGDGASYLGLTDPTNGLWARLGGPEAANGAGAGIIVGDIDTGIQPGHPSFADDPADGYVGAPFPAPPSTWAGTCQTGPGFPASSCNHKLIGARYFVAGFGADNLGSGSFVSPRDDDGHGSHTASTAAGNYGVDPSILGNDLGVDRISGIAPRAYVAAYKICWVGNGTTSPDGCSNADSVAAIDQAVADGVDVLNYSIGSSDSEILGPVEVSFLGASDAGVFVASSAGNDGPDAGTVGSPNAVPWLTSVAADTLHRTFTATATVSSAAAPVALSGASVTAALPHAPVVDAASAAAPGETVADAELCKPGTLNPAVVTGKVVLCRRGDNARIDKSRNVAAAGGVGMILYNASDAQELVTDTHYVPSIHVSFSQGQAVKAAIAAGGAQVTASTRGTADPTQPEKVLAAFSSRGPQTAEPDIAKPDVTAPGVNILAAAADQPAANTELPAGQLFQSISGTSMASPHVAGAGALLTQAHPLFTPTEIKSSLMTTANPAVKEEDGSTPATPFDAGSGEIDPNRAVDPGLVVRAGTADYLSYLKAVAPDVVTENIPATQPLDLNLPSISISQLAGSASVTRTFTSVDATAQHWSVAMTGLTGVTATADTAGFTVAPGQDKPVKLSFQVTSAPLDAYAYGALVLTNGSRTVRLPISVRPVAFAAPATIAVSTDQATGSKPVQIQTGFAGPFSAVGWGLAAPQLSAGRRISATTGSLAPGDPGTQLYPVTVPAGAQLIAGRTANVDAGDPNTDLDLYLLRDPNGDGNFADAETVATSGSASALESITVKLPAPGRYAFAVVGFTTKAGGTVYDFTSWLVADPSPDDPSNAPGLSVTGDGAATAIGARPTLAVNWRGVQAKGTYLGLATYHPSAAPTPANIGGSSVVELTKTTDTGAGGGTGGGSSPGGGTKPPGPGTGSRALRVRVASARVRGRTLRVRVKLTRAATLRAVVRRGRHTVTRAKARRVRRAGAATTVKLRLGRRLAPGRYTVRLIATRAHVRDVAKIRVRVRR